MKGYNGVLNLRNNGFTLLPSVGMCFHRQVWKSREKNNKSLNVYISHNRALLHQLAIFIREVPQSTTESHQEKVLQWVEATEETWGTATRMRARASFLYMITEI